VNAVMDRRLSVCDSAASNARLTAVSNYPAPHLTSYRSLWISDFHLGTRRCKAPELLDFLRLHRAECLFLVGDILDGWNFGPTWYWDTAQSAVVAEICAWRKRGTRVIYLPGNHDENSLDLIRALFGPLEISTDLIHRTADGCRMLVIHGHQLVSTLHPDRWLSLVGGHAYSAALQINLWYNRERNRTAGPAVSSKLRRRLKRAFHYLVDFDDRPVFEMARARKVDGVICGHTHRHDFRPVGPFLYINDGDWVQSRTALAEHADGRLELLQCERNRVRQFESERKFAAVAS
jgi:UDP-2,3-diacylglucosamine pyrophosphatase LpxH